MAFCPNMRLVMVSEWLGKPQYLDVMRVRCKQWSCPYCCVINSQLWKQYLLKRLNNSEFRDRKWVLITLTADREEHKKSPVATLRNLQRVWQKMRHRLARWNGAAFDYLRVFERHTKGKYGGYHLHVIADIGVKFEAKKADFQAVLQREQRARKLGLKPRKRLKKEVSPQRWIKDNCKRCGGGFIADMRPLKGGSHRAIRYVTKYTLKQIDILEFVPHARRIQTSRAIGSPNKRRNTGNPRRWRKRAAIWRADFDLYERIYDVSIKRHVTIEEDFSNGEHWYPPEMD